MHPVIGQCALSIRVQAHEWHHGNLFSLFCQHSMQRWKCLRDNFGLRGLDLRLNKYIGKKIAHLNYKDKNLLWSMSHGHPSCHGNILTPKRFFLPLYFSVSGFLFFRNRLRELEHPLVALIMAKFDQILWEHFGNIWKQSLGPQQTVNQHAIDIIG